MNAAASIRTRFVTVGMPDAMTGTSKGVNGSENAIAAARKWVIPPQALCGTMEL
ncbi:MAG TPA: hypothetical protein VN730_10345 [Steroidobacteraceae bacterium]|nr:hypothetical protein [Steroidobacteraceae bacterium]